MDVRLSGVIFKKDGCRRCIFLKRRKFVVEKVIFDDGFLIRNYLCVDFDFEVERVYGIECDVFIVLCLFVKL